MEEHTVSPEIRDAAAHFVAGGELDGCEILGGGHIHASYVLRFRAGTRVERFLLQRMNPRVFPRPEPVMENILRVTDHLRRKLAEEGATEIDRRVLTALGLGDPCLWRDRANGAWRMFHYIERTRTRVTVHRPEDAWRAARAFGEFQRRLADLPPPRLHEVLPGFHDTPARFLALDDVLRNDPHGRAAGAQADLEFALRRRGMADAWARERLAGTIPERVVHNDAKIANVLFDADSDEALAVVDLDTVMPGLALHDFGDMVRSMTCRAAEDEADLGAVHVDLDLFAAVAGGYLSAMGPVLTPAEREHLVTAGKLLTLEQGVRFLTDHLGGDPYYRTDHPRQNLDRARAQFALVESIERNEVRLREIVRSTLQ